MSSEDEKAFSVQHAASEPNPDEVCAPSSEPSHAQVKPSTRDMILERRSRFIAAALAGAGLASAACTDGPQVCLSIASAGGNTYTQPQVCLGMGGSGYNTGGSSGAGPIGGSAGAQACLSAGGGPYYGGAAGTGGIGPVAGAAGQGGAGPVASEDAGSEPLDAGETDSEDSDGGL